MFIGAYGWPFFTHSFYDFSSIHNDWERSSKTFLLATHCWMRLSLSLQMSLWTKFRRYFFSLDFQQGLSTVYWDSMRRDTKNREKMLIEMALCIIKIDVSSVHKFKME